jgi:TIR domain/CHAT domain
MPLYVLAIISQPVDAAPFEADNAWKTIRSACLQLGEGVSLERLPEATESALKRWLASRPVHALFFIGHGHARQGVGYGTLLLEGAGRKARAVNAQYFAALVRKHVPLVVLYAVGDDAPFAGVPEILVGCGVSAAIATRERLDDWSTITLFGQLFAAFGAGQMLASAVALLGAAFECAIDPQRAAQPLVPRQSIPVTAVLPTLAPVEDVFVQARREVEHKRAIGAFDVFLCHNTDDKPAVKRIGEQLKRQGLLPWLDEWELPPGVPWQQQLEVQIVAIRAAAVFVGRAGIGPWQQEELAALLSEFHRRKCPVIPVLLPDAPAQPRLPIFLSERTWVDFRIADPDPLGRLIWGITGRRPAQE